MPIINGRRIIVPSAGITGQSLIQQLNPAPVRKPIMQKDGSFSAIDPKRIYKPDELFDKDGNPVKLTTIPDRTKGATCGGKKERE